MELGAVRALAEQTLLTACPILVTEGTEDDPPRVFTTPKIDFDALSPVATIETQASITIWDARRLYTLDYHLAVFILAIADITNEAVPVDLPILAENQVTEIVLQAIPALRDAGFEVGDVSFLPRSSPWRKVAGVVYRWAQIPIVYHDEYGYEEV